MPFFVTFSRQILWFLRFQMLILCFCYSICLVRNILYMDVQTMFSEAWLQAEWNIGLVHMPRRCFAHFPWQYNNGLSCSKEILTSCQACRFVRRDILYCRQRFSVRTTRSLVPHRFLSYSVWSVFFHRQSLQDSWLAFAASCNDFWKVFFDQEKSLWTEFELENAVEKNVLNPVHCARLLSGISNIFR